MTTIAIFLFVSLAILAVGQGLLVAGFWRTVRNRSCKRDKNSFRRSSGKRDADWLNSGGFPKAAVILCLRGSDPFLTDCLRGLFNLDYPDFDIHIIVDHAGDPAWKNISSVSAEYHVTNLRLHTLTQRRETCSLKCSSLIQVISGLDNSCAFIALLDGDTIPHSTWLRELAVALDDELVGAATGNRWYCPHDNGWGSLVRYFWNAAAIVQMYWYGIAWGGTLAVKTRTIHEARLLEHWGVAFCEDTMLYTMLKKLNLKLKSVPELLIANRESCSLAGYFHWVTRQLLTTRLYHPRWWMVVFHGLSSTLLITSGLIVVVIAIFQQNTRAAIWATAGVVGFQLANYVCLFFIENAARMAIAGNAGSAAVLTFGQRIKSPFAIVLTQFVHFAALCLSISKRTVGWRRICYRVSGPWKITMQQYQPWCDTDDRNETVSL